MITTQNEFPTDRYEIQGMLGHGTYGEVYKALDLSTNTHVAIKKAKLKMWKDGMPSTFLREIYFLR
jgi:serine/threonine-protein kinase BUR1